MKLTHSATAVRGSCRDCGSPLFMKYHCRPDGTDVAMGIVDADDEGGNVLGEVEVPKEHIFWEKRLKWLDAGWDRDGLERCEGFPEGFRARLKEWEGKGRVRRGDVGEG